MAGLGDYPVSAVLRAEDYARAAKFYTEVLGLQPTKLGMGSPTTEGMFSAGDGTMLMIYERPGMPAPQNTTLGFGIPNDRFDDVMSDLKAKGVMFEDYDIPEIRLKTEGGVATYDGSKGAWFKDTEGNIVSINGM